ncbi:MAG: Hint domain-containing protein [Rhodospirillales bacterium]|nr:Hint domain-containing protein [Rhodospirillales bacterium]
MSGQTAFTVTDQASLAAAIDAMDLSGAASAPNTSYSITIAGGAGTAIQLTSDLPAINLASGDTLFINGGGATLHGDGHQRGLFVYAGNVAIGNLTISNTAAIGGSGGGGWEGGGGGAGLGGGLFVGSGATVALAGVIFTGNAAIGGNGGFGGGYGLGGGGGMGGAGGGGPAQSGGGGIGRKATGAGNGAAGAGIVTGVPATSYGSYSTAAGGGGGGGYSGGGVGAAGKNGGFGGGGAAYGSGGFGGGAGAFGRSGGWGGGGSGGIHAGPQGFGGGAGGAGSYIQQSTGYGYYGGYYQQSPGPAAGGGGLGAGGNVFVQQGGVLAIGAGALLNGHVTAGAAGGTTPGITNAFALGSAVFLQGYETLFLSPAVGQTLTVSGVIADQAGSGVGPTVQGSGTVVVSGGMVVLSAANTYTGPTVIDGGTLDLGSAQSAGSGSIVFTGGAGTLDIAAAAPGNPLVDFRSVDAIALAADPASVSYDPAQHVASYAGGSLHFDPTTAPRAIAYDAATGVLTVPCFAAGTRIATPGGAVAVERLRVGESVCLAEGGTAPVVWLGHRRIDCRRHPRPDDVHPVRIAAHAFGMGRPARDIRLSPDHAVFVDGVLIPVRYLLNDATVAQLAVATVTYWHVELPAHGVLLADGLPAESYLDSGNRAAFANGGTLVMAHADFARRVWTDRGCAPLVTEGAMRDRVYARLIAQALTLGWRAADAGGGAVRWIAPAAAWPVRRRTGRG